MTLHVPRFQSVYIAHEDLYGLYIYNTIKMLTSTSVAKVIGVDVHPGRCICIAVIEFFSVAW